jgi:AraC family transcriptional regulator of adaptative response / DNA-3-methyladenine glycosylase II
VELDPRICYEAIKSRDRRFEGRFVVAVATTGIYCRPGCPARTPRSENVRFYARSADAEAAGFRACLRCRPDRGVGASSWGIRSATVAHALRLLDSATAETSLDTVALQAGVSARQLRRLFEHELGASPAEVFRSRRLRFARELLEQTSLPMGDVALQAGFRSLRRFNAAVRDAFGGTPSSLRDAGEPAGTQLALRLAYRPPLAWDALAAFIGARAWPGVERVERSRYERKLAKGTILVEPDPERAALLLRVEAPRAVALLPLVAAVRRLFDLDADAPAIDRRFARDRRLAPLVAARPGVRVPGAFDAFELLVRAILGQQVSVAAATTLAGRLVARGPVTARALAAADLSGLGLTKARAAVLGDVARRVAGGELDLSRPLPALPGIGPWTREYFAMRALGDCDAFPSGDLVLRRHAEGAESWRPWRAYAAMHLWMEQKR